MLGGEEFPSTFRSIGKDSRQQINGLIEGLQYETLLSFDYEKLETGSIHLHKGVPLVASHPDMVCPSP